MTDKKNLNLRRDTLTNCYATEGFNPFLAQMEAEYLATRKPFSILIMDVDHFKSFNDKHGHLNGDEVLKYFSSSLRLDLEDEVNVPFRYGGDEFVVIFPEKIANEVFILAQRLRSNMRARSCLIKGRQQRVNFSGGIACYPTDTKVIGDLFAKADKAMYYSKRHGRARVMRYHELKTRAAIQVLAAFSLVFLALAAWAFSENTIQPAIDLAILKVKHVYHSARQTLHVPAWPAMKNEPVGLTFPEPSPASAAPTPSATLVPVTVQEPKTAWSKIYLTTGKSIRGVIVSQNDEWVKVQLGLDQGTGSVKIKRSQIKKIDYAD